MRTLLRWTGLVFVTVLVLFTASLAWPQWMLHEHMQRGQFEIWSAVEPDPRIFAILDSAGARIIGSELHDPTVRYKVFLCGDLATFTLFAPFSRDAFAVAYPVIDHIFVAHTDVANDRVFRPADEHSTRTLSGVLAHEATHLMVEHGLGLWKFQSMPVWQHEGYCDHIARESSIEHGEGLNQLCAGTLDHPYFEGRLMVEYLLEQGSTFREVAHEHFHAEELLRKVKVEKCQEP
ncbi:MAG: hypothetical protein KA175_06385 [Flavobacteriales bacterium]|nr:hypothetical protein [Flavobacteriales bacterium]MBP6697227.1 hypothetical protein [Flavobacteriales bacterium]